MFFLVLIKCNYCKVIQYQCFNNVHSLFMSFYLLMPQLAIFHKSKNKNTKYGANDVSSKVGIIKASLWDESLKKFNDGAIGDGQDEADNYYGFMNFISGFEVVTAKEC